jgi:hypothetical protein
MATNNRYTYVNFAQEAIALANGETINDIARFIAKANDLQATQEAKAAYNKANPKKATAKGASDETKAKAAQIGAILTNAPKTAAEINAELGTEYTALQVANAVKFIDGARSEKVIRETVNAKGLRSQKEYTGYAIG